MWHFVLEDFDDLKASIGLCPNLIKSVLTELNKYMKIKKINIKDDSIGFWMANMSDLSTLATLARVYLRSPASSSTSEREFKVGKSIQKDRIKLLPKKKFRNVTVFKITFHSLKF